MSFNLIRRLIDVVLQRYGKRVYVKGSSVLFTVDNLSEKQVAEIGKMILQAKRVED